MSLGLEASGFDIACSVELDPIHALVHHYNFPYGSTICKSVTDVTADEVLNALAINGYNHELDVVAGGPPCQGFSQIGKRHLDDPRNTLIFDFVNLIHELQPKYFIFENVPGMTVGKHRAFLNELIFKFEEIGYNLTSPVSVLDASKYGAPQKRKRLIILGSRFDMSPLSYPIEGYGEHSTQHELFTEKKPLLTCGEAMADLEGIDAFHRSDLGIESSDLNYEARRTDYNILPSGNYGLCHLRSHDNKVYGHIASRHTDKSIQRFKDTIPGTTESVSRFLRLHPNGLCNTLRAGTASNKGAHTAPRPIHYSQNRCITVREAARLHSYPDWFRFHNTIWHGFREIGNSVIPIFAKSLGDQIVRSLGVDIDSLKKYALESVSDEILSYPMTEAANYWDVPRDIVPTRKRLK